MNKRKTTKIATPQIDVARLQLLTIPDVARLLSIGRTSVYSLIKSRELETVRIGSSQRVRVLVISIHQYVERQKQS